MLAIVCVCNRRIGRGGSRLGRRRLPMRATFWLARRIGRRECVATLADGGHSAMKSGNVVDTNEVPESKGLG